MLTSYSFDGTHWNFSNRITSEFNANNQVTHQIFENADSITAKIFKNQRDYTYDENGNNTLVIDQHWNSATGIWENSQKYEMIYNDNLIIQQDSFTWAGEPDWPVTPQFRQIYDYTSDDI